MDLKLMLKKQTQKRILIFSPTGDFSNGAEKAGFYISLLLSRLGHQVINVRPTQNINIPNENSLEYDRKFKENGITVRSLEYSWWSERDEVNNYEAEMSAISELTSIIEEQKIDLVITNTSNIPWAAIASSLTDLPHIWLLHEFPVGAFNWLKDKYDFIADYSDAVFCASKSLSVYIKEVFDKISRNTPIEYFYPYTETELHSLKKSENIRLVTVGKLDDFKNQIELVRAVGKIKKDKKIKIEVAFIGYADESYSKQVIHESVSLGIADQIKLYPYSNNPWSIVTDHDIFVQCSKSEVFSLAICEAIKIGVPTILSDTPAANELNTIFQGRLTVYKRGSINQLASAIIMTTSNINEKINEASELKKLAVKNLSLERCSSNLVDYINHISKVDYRSKSNRHLKGYLTNTTRHNRSSIDEKTAFIDEQGRVIADLEERLRLIDKKYSDLINSKSWIFYSRIIRHLTHRSGHNN